MPTLHSYWFVRRFNSETQTKGGFNSRLFIYPSSAAIRIRYLISAFPRGQTALRSLLQAQWTLSLSQLWHLSCCSYPLIFWLWLEKYHASNFDATLLAQTNIVKPLPITCTWLWMNNNTCFDLASFLLYEIHNWITCHTLSCVCISVKATKKKEKKKIIHHVHWSFRCIQGIPQTMPNHINGNQYEHFIHAII